VAELKLKNLNLTQFQEEVARELGVDLTKPPPDKKGPPKPPTPPPDDTDRAR
jgi:hypothetical protein